MIRRPGNNSRGAVYDAGRTIPLVTCRGKTEITEFEMRAVYCSQSIGRQDRNDSIKTRNEKEKEKKRINRLRLLPGRRISRPGQEFSA